MMNVLNLRILLSTSLEDLSALQIILESAPEYWLKTSGGSPPKNAAEDIFKALPEGKSYKDKFVIGIHLHEELVGCIDVIRGFPQSNTAMLGLILVNEKHQRLGFGKASYRALEDLIRSWENIQIVRIGVIDTNKIVLPFWKSLGFKETGLRSPYKNGPIESETIVLERNLTNL